MPEPSPVILWFRADLRLHDHPALTAAIATGRPVLPLFVADERLATGRWASANRTWFLRESLAALDRALRSRGNGLVIREGRPEIEVPAIARETGATDVFVSREYTPFGRRRDRHVAEALADVGVAFHARRGRLAIEPEAVRTAAGGPFSVFSPFERAWQKEAQHDILRAPDHVPGLATSPVSVMPAWLAEARPTATELLEPGEGGARERLANWVESRSIEAYAGQRDRLDIDGTSRLSQDLRWGLVSPGEVIAVARGDGEGRRKFVNEVTWREFYTHLLWHHPEALHRNFRTDLEAIPWRNDPGGLAAWQRGETGYPVVDAAMRQLAATGWMHNRARMIVASFLTKHLLIHWRQGEAHFMHHLFDGDPANNNGGWQWAASTGADPQPYFRVFNPVLQGKRFDPDGAFVRRWVPELRHAGSGHIHEPWRLSGPEQRAAGCVIGRDYPAPIVELDFGRQRALAAFEAARQRAT